MENYNDSGAAATNKKIIFGTVGVLAVFGLMALAGIAIDKGSLLAGASHSPEDALRNEAHLAVAALMKDPEAARFDDSNARIYPEKGLFCGGLVNGKNSFGAYSGREEYSFKRGKGAVLGAVGETVEATELFGECVDALSAQLTAAQKK